MIIVDTSIWVDHLAAKDAALQRLLDDNDVLMHPFIIGEIAMGSLGRRAAILRRLSLLPRSVVAGDGSVLDLVERASLFGSGVGYIDCHLLAAAQPQPGVATWTRDRRSAQAARRLGLDSEMPKLH